MAAHSEVPSEHSEPITIRPLLEGELDAADSIFRVAFGTFLGIPNPETFGGSTKIIHTRWLAHPSAALAAEVKQRLVGSNLLTRWGSVGFFGPLTVEPSHWDRGIAQKLLVATLDVFNSWQLSNAGLFTFSHSPKHISLYQKFDFWPRSLTMIMDKTTSSTGKSDLSDLFSKSEGSKQLILTECFALTDSIYSGLDLRGEILAVDNQHLGDTVLLREDGRLVGFAVCHCGAGSEADTGSCYVKFAAIDARRSPEWRFAELLKSCESYAVSKGATRLIAGVNTSRIQAYRALLDLGFRTNFQGVVMQRANERGYNREDVYLIDDWR